MSENVAMEANWGQALSQNIYKYCINKEKTLDIDEFSSLHIRKKNIRIININDRSACNDKKA